MKADALHPIPVEQFQLMGVADIAYVKPIAAESGAPVFAIHLADGRKVGEAPDRDTAFAAVRRHDLEPLSVH